MTTENTQQASALSGLSSLRRWLLAAVGVFFFGVGALGVFVPGMPTTIFLILASWCFTRSCPWLERKLIQTPLFRPFQAYLQPDAVMPRRARIIALVMMWTAITASCVTLRWTDQGSPLYIGLILAAGAAGTVAIVRMRRGRK